MLVIFLTHHVYKCCICSLVQQIGRPLDFIVPKLGCTNHQRSDILRMNEYLTISMRKMFSLSLNYIIILQYYHFVVSADKTSTGYTVRGDKMAVH